MRIAKKERRKSSVVRCASTGNQTNEISFPWNKKRSFSFLVSHCPEKVGWAACANGTQWYFYRPTSSVVECVRIGIETERITECSVQSFSILSIITCAYWIESAERARKNKQFESRNLASKIDYSHTYMYMLNASSPATYRDECGTEVLWIGWGMWKGEEASALHGPTVEIQ